MVARGTDIRDGAARGMADATGIMTADGVVDIQRGAMKADTLTDMLAADSRVRR
jgi:hypothetical protein